MKLLKYPSILLLILLLFLGCTKDDSKDNSNGIGTSTIEFTSFEIINNTENLFRTETSLNVQGLSLSSFTNHGIELFYNNQLQDRIDQGVLTDVKYNSNISKNMAKGFTYSVRPYVIFKNEAYFGDFISFESNLSIEIEINDISPLTGFVNDTIKVKGKKFCNTTTGIGNLLILGGFYQNIISTSDTMLIATISPNALESKAKFELESCRVKTESDFEFVFDPPQLDSISSKEYYVGEKSTVYCKNLHPKHTKVWLNEIELEVNQERDSIVDLEFFIPDNLPPGKLDFKMQVIDRVLELKQAYQSTTPEITEIDKIRTGFLDTITIKGKYLIQPNISTKVSIGEVEQTILAESPNEIKVLINQYFTVQQPKLKYQVGTFEIEKEIEMLPPEIISFDKEQYHLQDDVVRVKTKYFLGYSDNIKVADQSLSRHDPFENVDEKGYVNIDLNHWLDIQSNFPEFTMEETGKIGLSITTAYGDDLKKINIVPPTITSINKDEFYYGERLVIKGDDLGYNIGYRGIGGLYFNDERIPISGNSNYSFKNQEIYLPMPTNAKIGVNTLKVITGGQTSNIVEFDIIEVAPDGLVTNRGTRKDIFEIVGQNLFGKVHANGFVCDIVQASDNSIKFRIPHWLLLSEPVAITLDYGNQTFDIGLINGIEPFEIVENYSRPDNLSGYSHFEYMNEFYIVNSRGILKLDLNSGTWELVESNFGDIPPNSTEINESFISDGKIYFPSKKSFKVYDLSTKQWENKINLQIPDDLDVWYATVNNNVAYIVTRSASFLKFYGYNLTTHEIIDLPQPRYFPNGVPNIFAIVNNFRHYNGRVYLELYGTIQIFDINSNNWTDLGHPSRESNRQLTNLYEFNGVLYLSGGLLSSSSAFYDLYAYDLSTAEWSEKTYLPSVLGQHSVFGHNNKLYFFLGEGVFRITNQQMFSYNISGDPH